MTDWDKGTIALGWCHGTEVTAGFANSMIGLLTHELTSGLRRLVTLFPEYSNVNVANGRNKIVQKFLDESDADWLLMIDSDMVFGRDLIDRLMRNADADHAVIGALCFGVDAGKLFPTLYAFVKDEERGFSTIRYHEYPPDQMFQVGATGAACFVVHRTVLEGVRDYRHEDTGAPFSDVYTWFQETTLNGQRCGEDVTFFLRVGMCGYPVWVDTGCAIGHQKAWILNEEQFAEQRAIELAARAVEEVAGVDDDAVA